MTIEDVRSMLGCISAGAASATPEQLARFMYVILETLQPRQDENKRVIGFVGDKIEKNRAVLWKKANNPREMWKLGFYNTEKSVKPDPESSYSIPAKLMVPFDEFNEEVFKKYLTVQEDEN